MKAPHHCYLRKPLLHVFDLLPLEECRSQLVILSPQLTSTLFQKKTVWWSWDIIQSVQTLLRSLQFTKTLHMYLETHHLETIISSVRASRGLILPATVVLDVWEDRVEAIALVHLIINAWMVRKALVWKEEKVALDLDGPSSLNAILLDLLMEFQKLLVPRFVWASFTICEQLSAFQLMLFSLLLF